MDNLSKKDVELFQEYEAIMKVRELCFTNERSLFNAVVFARKGKLDKVILKSLQGVLLCLRTCICLVNNVLFSGRYSSLRILGSCSDSEDLPF